LLQAPTVAQFSALVDHASVPVDIVVKVREGKPGRAPFFCIPGAGGNILSLRPLALAMPEDVPFYCLQAKGLDGRSDPFTTVEATALCYVEEMRRIQPSGPYHLGGGCYGGVVAFETARLLQEAGESIHLLALIDSTNAAYGRSLPLHTVLTANVHFYLARAREHVRALQSGSWAGRLAKLRASVRSGLHALRNVAAQPTDGTGLTEILDRVMNASLHAAATFVPQPYSGSALLFRAGTRSPEVYDDGSSGWTPVVGGGITVVDVAGDHETLFVEPNVRAVASRIAAALEECDTPKRVPFGRPG
jgi:thioesterase domain-containing protein